MSSDRIVEYWLDRDDNIYHFKRSDVPFDDFCNIDGFEVTIKRYIRSGYRVRCINHIANGNKPLYKRNSYLQLELPF